MRKQARMWVLAGSLLVAGPLVAEPLGELRSRVAGMRNDQPVRIHVDVELSHRGSAPLHLNKSKRRGEATVVHGPKGVESLTQKSLGTSSRFSFWKESNVETEMQLLDETEANDLADPAGMIEQLLSEAILLSDESVTWKGRPARFLVIRPGQLPVLEGSDGDRTPLNLEARIWLDESGTPLAMERAAEFRLGSALVMTETQSFTFREEGGRLQVAEAEQTSSSRALAVLRGRDSKTMKVTSVKPVEGPLAQAR